MPDVTQLISWLGDAAVAGGIPPGTMYVKLATPLGAAVVDPFAAGQDPTTQQIMQRLGVKLTMGFGPAPAPEPHETSLAENTQTLLILGAGALAAWFAPVPWWGKLAIGGAAALWAKPELLASYFPGRGTPSATP